MKYILFILSITLLTSCASQRYCQPSRKSKDWAVLKPGTITDSLYVKTTLISATRTMKGVKNTFIAENGDTIIRYENKALKVGECYLVLKNI